MKTTINCLETVRNIYMCIPAKQSMYDVTDEDQNYSLQYWVFFTVRSFHIFNMKTTHCEKTIYMCVYTCKVSMCDVTANNGLLLGNSTGCIPRRNQRWHTRYGPGYDTLKKCTLKCFILPIKYENIFIASSKNTDTIIFFIFIVSVL